MADDQHGGSPLRILRIPPLRLRDLLHPGLRVKARNRRDWLPSVRDYPRTDRPFL